MYVYTVQSLHLCLILCNPMDCQAPLSMVFSRQEYWSGLPCSPPGDFPDPGIESVTPALHPVIYIYDITGAVIIDHCFSPKYLFYIS